MYLSSKKVLTRKPHKCWGCADEIPKGSSMKVVNEVELGRIMSFYWCDVCDAFIQQMDDTENGFEFGEFRNEPVYKEFKQNFKAIEQQQPPLKPQ